MSWKDHPIAAAAVSCVATLGVCYKLLIPVYTSTLEDKVLRNRDEIASLQEQLSKAKEKAKKLEIANSTLISDATLKPCNPYPISLDYIKLGDPIQKVFDFYSDPKFDLDKSKAFVTVRFSNNKVFRAATYLTAGQKEIRSIIFFYSGVELPDGKEKLQESPQQLGILKQVKDAFPNARVTPRNDPDEPGYDVALAGKDIIRVDPTAMHIGGMPGNYSECKRAL